MIDGTSDFARPHGLVMYKRGRLQYSLGNLRKEISRSFRPHLLLQKNIVVTSAHGKLTVHQIIADVDVDVDFGTWSPLKSTSFRLLGFLGLQNLKT